MALEIRILGPLEVVAGGELRRLGGKKQRTLLALLALDPGEVVPADRLIEELWPAYDPRAQARLQVYVSQLRKALGEAGSAIEHRSGGYVLQLPPDAVDARRFERQAAEGGSALRAGDPEQAAGTLREALDLWRAAPLEDCDAGSLARPAVARLEELRLSAMEDRIDAELALGRAAELVDELEALTSEQPLRERLRTLQMLALHRAGRREDALDAYEAARARLLDELGIEPGPDLRRLHELISGDDPVLRVEPEELRARRHLPTPATALVGRRAQVDDLVRILRAPGVRLLTLTGPGGAGKTRLAIQAAADLAGRFDDGVYFVELAPVEDAAQVAQAAVAALGADERPDEPQSETLARHLRDRRVLLVLDNFEHVQDAAPLVSELLEAAPELKVLVTSRAPLRLLGEHEYLVPGLSLPEGVELFVARAEAAGKGFHLTDENADTVGEICATLDGLPLAIELVAARSRMLSPEDMLAGFPARLELAGEGPRNVSERQQTLRATIDWSYGLLALDARALFARLAVFVGGFGMEAADEVCGADRSGLAELVERNLLAARVTMHGTPRFSMLETIREFALERLTESGEAESVRRRHAAHFVVLAEAAEPTLAGSEGEHWVTLLSDEHPNLQAALAWSRLSGSLELELRLVGALVRFWEISGYVRQGRAHLELALDRGQSQPRALRAKALIGAARIANRQGDYAAVLARASESRDLYESVGDMHGVADSLRGMATGASNAGDYERGWSLYEQSLAVYRELEDDLGLGAVMTDLGCLALMEGDADRGADLTEEALEHYAKVGDRYATFPPLFNLAIARLGQGRAAEALERFRNGLELGRELGYREQVVYFLEGLAAAHAAEAQHELAAKLLGAAGTAAAEMGMTLEPLEQDMHDRAVAQATEGLGQAGFRAALAEGGALSLDDAVALALAQPVG
ncbi:MAG TPA: BTAD domain-containing putative transcriptional regulator [Thermoleophilaceae bacterium]